MLSPNTSSVISHSPLLAQATARNAEVAAGRCTRISIRPMAILEVVRRRGRSWGLLAQYEEARLGCRSK
jgi:hypothetical protein